MSPGLFSHYSKTTLAVASTLVFAIGGLVQPAAAGGAVVAIVEDTSDGVTDYRTFDMLSEGTEIRLDADQSITLGYLKSCTKEIIKGGHVSVGAESSVVEGGEVTRSKVPCAISQLTLALDEADQSAIVAFRPAGQEPTKKIFTKVPVIIARTSKIVILAPIDGGTGAAETRLRPESGRIDFQKANIVLSSGHRYRLTGDNNSMILLVAEPLGTNDDLLERVVVLD